MKWKPRGQVWKFRRKKFSFVVLLCTCGSDVLWQEFFVLCSQALTPKSILFSLLKIKNQTALTSEICLTLLKEEFDFKAEYPPFRIALTPKQEAQNPNDRQH